MYLRHYGLRDKPFNLAHDPRYYYAAVHQVPMNELCYSIEERQGLATLVGEPGTGKTTLLRRLLQSLGPHQRGVYVSDTSLAGQSLLRQIVPAVRVLLAGKGKATSQTLRELLTRARDKTVVLLIDEAQGLTQYQLKEVHLLTNLEVPGRKLVEIIMAGQPSLEDVLAAPALAALRQRVAVRCRFEPYDLEHTRGYIEHRLRVAGARDISLFTPDAVKLIHEHSRGVPRLINIICERCLVFGYANNIQLINGPGAQAAIADLRMEPEQESEVSAATQAVGNGLLLRMATRIEALEKKLDMLVQMLARAGIHQSRAHLDDSDNAVPDFKTESN